IEYVTVTELVGQDMALFGAITLVAIFIIFQEYLANKGNIKIWMSNRNLLKTTPDNKMIIKQYSLFSIALLLLFSLMVLIGENSLPIRFPIPPGIIQERLNFDILFFELRSYGNLFGIIGLMLIGYSYFFLKRNSLPSQLREVLFLPYFYFSLSSIFVFFSLAIFFKFDSLVLFTALYGTLIVLSARLMAFEWLFWKKEKYNQYKLGVETEEGHPTHRIQRFYFIICLLFVILAFALSYFPIYIGPFVLPLMILILLVIMGGLITSFEIFSWKRNPIHKSSLSQEEEKTNESLNVPMRFYLYILTVLVVFSILMFYIGDKHLPMQVNLFFFQLYNIGSLFGIVGIIIIITGFLLTSKMLLPTESRKIYFLPILFKFLAVIFTFQALYTFFELDPFLLISLTLIIATPIGFASLGGMFSEKAGVVNIGLEGMMLTGAFVAVFATHITNDPWAGVAGSIIAGTFMGFLHAVASIKYRANQVVVGVALNLLASATTALGIWVVWESFGQSNAVRSLPLVKLDFLADIPLVGDFLYSLTNRELGLSPLVYVFITLIFVSAWIIYRTTFGLRVRSVGEYPRAADTLGINVYRIRYICVILSGILAAVGGAQLTLGWIPIFNKDMVAGRGFVALAALIFGSWNPIGAAFASIFFGFAYSFRFQLEPQLSQLGIDWILFDLHLEDLTPMLPFVVTLVAVGFVAKRMRAPAADGIPYIKEG
ncbi:MAG: ABC transporter permease, partial [Candidatus Hodarchaeales archaeon]